MTRIGIKLNNSKSNLRSTVKWFDYLSSNKYKSDVKKSYEGSGNLKDIEKEARLVIEQEIYSKNTTTGTGRIAQSMTVESAKGKTPGIILFSDPSIAPSEAGSSPGKFSYLAFFEDPRFKSFIRAEDPLDPIKYRPFMNQLTVAFNKINRRKMLRALMINIRKRKPRRQ